MTRIELGGRRVLVDCGVAQGAEAFEWQLDEAALDVDAALLTHAHHDHVGSLPTLIDKGYAGPIYATPATIEIAKVVLEDGLALQGFGRAESARLMREIQDRLRPLGLDMTVGLGASAEFAFREAGHILGSAERGAVVGPEPCVSVREDPRSTELPLLCDYQTTWSAARPVDLALLESTYGDEETPPRA